MINYNEGDLHTLDGYEEILEKFKGESVTDDEVWEVARESKKVPHFENILLNMTLSRIVDLIEDSPLSNVASKFNVYVNARDTHFSFDDEDITDYDSFVKIVGDHLKNDNDSGEHNDALEFIGVELNEGVADLNSEIYKVIKG